MARLRDAVRRGRQVTGRTMSAGAEWRRWGAGAARSPGSFGPAAAAAAASAAAGGRRQGRKRLPLVRRQHHVLRLDDRDLHLQLALLGLQVGAHRGGLLGGGLGVGGRLGRRLPRRRRPAAPTSRKFFICADISVAITRCIGELVDQPLRRRRRSASRPGRRCGRPCTARRRSCRRRIWNVASWTCADSTAAGVGGVLGFGGLLDCQLVVQIQLGGVHGFGGLLGLPRQLVELCQRIVGRVGLHTVRRGCRRRASSRLSHRRRVA